MLNLLPLVGVIIIALFPPKNSVSRHLPIQPNYRGRQVDAINDEKVLVNWKETKGEDAVYLVNN